MTDLVHVNFTISVTDRKALRRAALLKAMDSGMTAHEWRDLRRGDFIANDVQMLIDSMPFDEQLIAGIQIEGSTAESMHIRDFADEAA